VTACVPSPSSRSTATLLTSRTHFLELQPNLDDQTPEQIDGLGGQEQKRVRDFVWSRVGRPE
jgi:hypothetical protein